MKEIKLVIVLVFIQSSLNCIAQKTNLKEMLCKTWIPYKIIEHKKGYSKQIKINKYIEDSIIFTSNYKVIQYFTNHVDTEIYHYPNSGSWRFSLDSTKVMVKLDCTDCLELQSFKLNNINYDSTIEYIFLKNTDDWIQWIYK